MISAAHSLSLEQLIVLQHVSNAYSFDRVLQIRRTANCDAGELWLLLLLPLLRLRSLLRD